MDIVLKNFIILYNIPWCLVSPSIIDIVVCTLFHTKKIETNLLLISIQFRTSVWPNFNKSCHLFKSNQLKLQLRYYLGIYATSVSLSRSLEKLRECSMPCNRNFTFSSTYLMQHFITHFMIIAFSVFQIFLESIKLSPTLQV